MAYLRQLDEDDLPAEYQGIPRLFRRTPLGYDTTLLCVLLARALRVYEEEDVQNERCVVSQTDLLALWQAFFPTKTDEGSVEPIAGCSAAQTGRVEVCPPVRTRATVLGSSPNHQSADCRWKTSSACEAAGVDQLLRSQSRCWTSPQSVRKNHNSRTMTALPPRAMRGQFRSNRRPTRLRDNYGFTC